MEKTLLPIIFLSVSQNHFLTKNICNCVNELILHNYEYLFFWKGTLWHYWSKIVKFFIVDPKISLYSCFANTYVLPETPKRVILFWVTRYAWYLHEMCLKCNWDLPDECLRYSWKVPNIPEICLRYAWDKPVIWLISKIFLRCAWDINSMYLEYEGDMTEQGGKMIVQWRCSEE